DVRLRAYGLAHILAGVRDGVFAEGEADHVGEDEWPALRDGLLTLALQRPGVFGEDAGTFLGGEEAGMEGFSLPAGLGEAAEEDQGAPGEANVASDLFRPQQHALGPIGLRFPGRPLKGTLCQPVFQG